MIHVLIVRFPHVIYLIILFTEVIRFTAVVV